MKFVDYMEKCAQAKAPSVTQAMRGAADAAKGLQYAVRNPIDALYKTSPGYGFLNQKLRRATQGQPGSLPSGPLSRQPQMSLGFRNQEPRRAMPATQGQPGSLPSGLLSGPQAIGRVGTDALRRSLSRGGFPGSALRDRLKKIRGGLM